MFKKIYIKMFSIYAIVLGLTSCNNSINDKNKIYENDINNNSLNYMNSLYYASNLGNSKNNNNIDVQLTVSQRQEKIRDVLLFESNNILDVIVHIDGKTAIIGVELSDRTNEYENIKKWKEIVKNTDFQIVTVSMTGNPYLIDLIRELN